MPELRQSPQRLARLAGGCEFLEGATSTFGQVFVTGRLVVFGNAAATAANILGNERLFWQGFASSLIAVFFHLAWAGVPIPRHFSPGWSGSLRFIDKRCPPICNAFQCGSTT